MDYILPDVYVQREPNAQKVESKMTGTVSGFIGVTERGALGVVQEVNSWREYVSKFGKGMVSPFYINSVLAYSVYGYFQNGGGKCYIVRTAHDTATKATLQIGAIDTGVTITAKDEGLWGNKIFITIAVNAKNASNFDVSIHSTISGSSKLVEIFSDLSNSTTSDRYFNSVINKSSKYISVTTGALSAKVSTALEGGLDGVSDITDEDFIGKLPLLDSLKDLSLLAIPGQTSNAVNIALLNYSKTRRVSVFPDLSPTITAVELEGMRNDTFKGNGFCTFPSVAKIVDPLSPVNALKEVPVSGYVMGVYARMVKDFGIGQAPSGVDAVVKGFVSIDTVSEEDLPILYENQINPILNDPEYGIVIWGEKSLSEDSRMVRGANLLLANFLESSIEKDTRWVVFKSINESLMEAVKTQVDGIMTDLWKRGNLRGVTPKEAFFTKCDTELNTKETIEEGKFMCQIAYRPNKSAEFVIFTVSHLID